MDKYDEIINIITEAKMSAKERNALPASAFGLPEDRKYPLTDAAHVRSAIRLFGHCPEEKKPMLARRITRAAKKYGVTIPADSEVAKYLKKPTKNDKKQSGTQKK